jgi:hypothetical protein
MAKAGRHHLAEGWKEVLDMPITLDELQRAVNKWEGNKASGRDGMCLEFYKATRGALKGEMVELFNQMFLDRKLSDQQKQGFIVCIPKTTGPTQPTGFRPIRLLNNDYKILDRITANRIPPNLADLLHPSQ